MRVVTRENIMRFIGSQIAFSPTMLVIEAAMLVAGRCSTVCSSGTWKIRIVVTSTAGDILIVRAFYVMELTSNLYFINRLQAQL